MPMYIVVFSYNFTVGSDEMFNIHAHSESEGDYYISYFNCYIIIFLIV